MDREITCMSKDQVRLTYTILFERWFEGLSEYKKVMFSLGKVTCPVRHRYVDYYSGFSEWPGLTAASIEAIERAVWAKRLAN
tara:strand:- start:550 stop:795 length:246 start_codon:yes stop_codon:yes gene_type:complete